MPAGGSLLISDLVIPAPRSHGSWISKETLGGLIVPKPYCENDILFSIIIIVQLIYSVDDLTRIDSVENLTADDDVPEFTRGRVTDLIKVREDRLIVHESAISYSRLFWRVKF